MAGAAEARKELRKSIDTKLPNLRVLHIGPLPPPVGGMATVVVNLLSTLEPYCKIRLLDNQKTTLENRALWQGILAQLRQLWQLFLLCINWRPSIVHIHTCSWFTFWRNTLDVAVSKLLFRRIVLHIHGGQFHKFLNSLSWWQSLLVRLVFRASDRVVVLSEEWSRRLSGWCVPEKLVVVPNGVPVQSVGHKQKDGLTHILCLANYSKDKGQDDLIRAVAGTADPSSLRISLLGAEAEKGHQDSLRRLVDELNLEKQVEIPGPKIGSEKQSYLDEADIFCLPSYDEGLPMSMLEAMAAGVPVIVTRVGAIPEVVSDGVDGFLYDPGNIEDLAKCIDYLVEDPSRSKNIGLAGYERVKQKYSIGVAATRIMTIYRELALPKITGS